MNLGQAYQGWQQQSQNRDLYVKTREAFRKAWFTLPTNKPCSYYTKEVLGTALAETREIESNKVKAASVMCHVLTWANWAEPKFNPKPDFTYQDLMEYTKGPLADPEKVKPVSKPTTTEEDGTDLDIDPVTAMPRKAMEQEATEKKPDHCDGCNNVNGCITCIDGDQRAVITEVETKTEEDMEPKEKKPRGKQPKPVVQIDPNTLQVIKQWPSMSDAQTTLGICHVDVAVAKMRKAGGFYWSLAEDADTFKDRLDAKQKAVLSSEDNKKNAKAAKLLAKAKAEQKAKKDAEAHEAQKKSPKAEPKSLVDKFNEEQQEFEQMKREGKIAVTKSAPSEEEQVRSAARDALEVFTDDELLEELDRRGWQGELRRMQVVSIGNE